MVTKVKKCTENNYNPPCLLGKGGFAHVVLQKKKNGQEIAKKYLRSNKDIYLFKKQYENLAHLKDKNICNKFICLIGASSNSIEMKYLKNYVNFDNFLNFF